MHKTIVIIPARYASTRFPGKPLATLRGCTIIQRVYMAVEESCADVYVATDDQRIFNEVKAFGGRAVMTSPDHRSGTDRCLEALEKIEAAEGKQWDIVINVQGDEPFINSNQLTLVRCCFQDPRAQIGTLVKYIPADATIEELENPNMPKVVFDDEDFALYFSRSVIPYLRGVPREEWAAHHRFYKHIGIYGVRTDVLREIAQLPQSPLEQCESLEQLRWLQAGYRIKVSKTPYETIGIDTPEDLQRAESFFEGSEELKKIF